MRLSYSLIRKKMQEQVQVTQPSAISDSDSLPLPQFEQGDRVYWYRVPTHDFGIVLDRFYSSEGSVQALGWHYTVQLDPASPSFAHCKTDYGFEDDLALLNTEPRGTDAAD